MAAIERGDAVEAQAAPRGCCDTTATAQSPPPVISIALGSLSAPAAVGTSGSASSGSCCAAPSPATLPARPWHAPLQPLGSVWTFIAAIPLLVLLLDPERLLEVLQIAGTALAGTAPYVALAVLLIAWLKAADADALVARAFEGRENRMIVLAALFGGLAPFCSCQVIPFVAGLLALGAPVSAVMAFWLSSPLIDPGSLLVTAGALGWDFAGGKALAAVFLGLFGGFGVKLLLRGQAFSTPLKPGALGGCSSGTCVTTAMPAGEVQWVFWRDVGRRRVFIGQLGQNALFLLKWLTLAYLLEALLILYVPASLVGGLVGGEGLGPIVFGALVGMPAYLNSYAAPPLVAGLMQQGMSAGSAMAFMVAGAISSIPAMTAVWSLVRREVFIAYLGFGVSGAVLFAVVFAAWMGV